MARHISPRVPVTGRHRAPKQRGQRLVLSAATLLTVGVVTVGAAWQQDQMRGAALDASLPNPSASAGTPTPVPTAPPTTAPAGPPVSKRSKPVRITPQKRPRPVLPEQGAGTFVTAQAASDVAAGITATYRVEVERGVPIAIDAFARSVTGTLSDRRSWIADGHNLARVGDAADFRVVLASPKTADALCAPLDTGGRLSCRNGEYVVINAWRWLNGAAGYERRLRAYQRYVINHEVGHALGYPHVSCPATDALAPVMLQQTKGLDGCRPNPWPAAVDLS